MRSACNTQSLRCARISKTSQTVAGMLAGMRIYWFCSSENHEQIGDIDGFYSQGDPDRREPRGCVGGRARLGGSARAPRAGLCHRHASRRGGQDRHVRQRHRTPRAPGRSRPRGPAGSYGRSSTGRTPTTMPQRRSSERESVGPGSSGPPISCRTSWPVLPARRWGEGPMSSSRHSRPRPCAATRRQSHDRVSSLVDILHSEAPVGEHWWLRCRPGRCRAVRTLEARHSRMRGLRRAW